MDYEVELQPGRDQTEESLLVRHADGTTECFRLHEYDRVYAIPGLYEEVVQRRLHSASATILAERLVACAADAGLDPRWPVGDCARQRSPYRTRRPDHRLLWAQFNI